MAAMAVSFVQSLQGLENRVEHLATEVSAILNRLDGLVIDQGSLIGCLGRLEYLDAEHRDFNK